MKLKGFQKIDWYIIFDVNMGDNFQRKARLVERGHTTEAPAYIAYASVVSRDSLIISLMIAALNGLKVLSYYIQNSYLTAPLREKACTTFGPEFGLDTGKVILIVRYLYGINSSGHHLESS